MIKAVVTNPEGLADWVEFVTKGTDIFSTDHCGYWLRGVAHGTMGWLGWEDDEEHRFDHEPDRGAALAAWQDSKPLPPGWFRLDEALAQKAWEIGLKKFGEHWYDEGDSTTYLYAFDVVLQLALLGEVRYG